MTLKNIKTLGTAAVALAVAGGTVTYLSQSPPAPLASVAVPEKSSHPEDNDQLAHLEAENRRLAEALTQANADKREAEESAIRYRELAEKVKAENPTPLEAYPTPRHVLAGFGRQMMLARRAMNSGNLSPEEKRAAEARVLREDPEGARLAQAMIELKMDIWANQRRNIEEAADLFTCVLHGALDLNQQQYSQIDAVLKNYYRMAGVTLLSLNDMSLAGVTDDRSPSGCLDPNTLRQIQNLLTPAQKEDFQQLTKPQN